MAAAWSRLRTSFSSLPTTTTNSPSSSPPPSSASLYPSLLLDLADDLWFYGSVLPSLSFPCLPSLSSSSSSSSSLLTPDPSTLIAQCMITDFSPSSPPLPPSSSSSSSPPLGSDPSLHTQYSPWGLPAYQNYPAQPHSNEEDDKKVYNENAYRWYASTTDSDEDDDNYDRYPQPGAGEDEDAYHYYTAPSDWDEEDAYHGYAAHSDCEDEQQTEGVKEDAERGIVLPAYPDKRHDGVEPDDALSGIYDVGDLLKDQHHEATQEVSDKSLTDSQFPEEAVSVVSTLPHTQVLSYSEQAAMKESIKLWAHAVALTLPWKAAAKARPLL